MSNHDFIPLIAQYRGVIAQMPPVFGAHEFILQLAQQNQRLYVEALYAYKDSPAQGTPTPFMIVHGRLAKSLGDFPDLIKYEGTMASKDIFGHDNGCSQWRKV